MQEQEAAKHPPLTVTSEAKCAQEHAQVLKQEAEKHP